MSHPTWSTLDEPQGEPISLAGWVRVLVRGITLGGVVFGGLAVMLIVRVLERPVYGLHRPYTPFITQFVSRTAFVILGIRFQVQGTRMKETGAVVANHSSWLDIFALNARKRVYFVSKAEVAAWPGIGWLARATGTVFIRRERRDARAQVELFQERLTAGHKLLFFPEGTSSDSRRVLPFKSTLFAAFFAPELHDIMHIQPVTVIYHAPKGEDPRFYGWWGDMDLAPHLLKTLAARRQGRIELIYHPFFRVADLPDRKALAARCENTVRAPLVAAGLDFSESDAG